MTLVIGTDEAGYGPNLGPLVVAATAWEVDAEPAALEAALERAAAAAASGGHAWADSKRIYKAGAGLAALEEAVLTAVVVAGGPVPDRWPVLAAALGVPACDTDPLPEAEPLAALALPLEAAADAATRAATVASRLADCGVRLVAVRARVIQPQAFNALLNAGLNKSDLLSQATLELAAGVAAGAAAPVVWCDRHGGRKRYAGLVARHFETPLVQVLEETAARSVYAIGGGRIEFSVGGEARPPVALASMTAKYVRELAMRAFNAFWCDRDPGLAGTAGYPVDAARWRHAAAAAVGRAGVEWDRIWRRS